MLSQCPIPEIAQLHLALTCAVNTNLKAQEATKYIVVNTRDFHAGRMSLPAVAVILRIFVSYHLMIVSDPQTQTAGFYWHARPGLFFGVLKRFYMFGCKAKPYKRFMVVKQYEPGFGVAN